MNAPAALDVTGLHCSFGNREILSGVSLALAPGTLTAVLGASGSGKTTLLRLVCGFERPSSGSIAIDGRLVSSPTLFLPPERRHIGYVAQDGALFPHLSVADNILFGLRRAARLPARAAELLALVGLPADYAARPPQELSGGEQQRVALARALAPAPNLILLDEPFSALDAALRLDTRRAVAHALAAVGATTLMVTHDQSEALSMGDRVAVLRAGRLAQVATPTELYRHPADPDLARFVGEAVLLRGTARGDYVESPLGLLVRDVAGADGEVQILVRPEQLRLLDAAAATIQGIVAGITYYGHDASVRLAVELPAGVSTITARVAGHAAPAVGAVCGIAVEGSVACYPWPKAARGPVGPGL